MKNSTGQLIPQYNTFPTSTRKYGCILMKSSKAPRSRRDTKSSTMAFPLPRQQACLASPNGNFEAMSAATFQGTSSLIGSPFPSAWKMPGGCSNEIPCLRYRIYHQLCDEQPPFFP